MELLFIVYFSINVGLAVYYLVTKYDGATTARERSALKIMTALFLLFGCIDLIMRPVVMFLRALHVKFFFEFYFTHKWDNVPRKKLNRLSGKYRAIKNSGHNSFRHRIFKLCARMIFKNNRYGYEF